MNSIQPVLEQVTPLVLGGLDRISESKFLWHTTVLSGFGAMLDGADSGESRPFSRMSSIAGRVVQAVPVALFVARDVADPMTRGALIAAVVLTPLVAGVIREKVSGGWSDTLVWGVEGAFMAAVKIVNITGGVLYIPVLFATPVVFGGINLVLVGQIAFVALSLLPEAQRAFSAVSRALSPIHQKWTDAKEGKQPADIADLLYMLTEHPHRRFPTVEKELKEWTQRQTAETVNEVFEELFERAVETGESRPIASFLALLSERQVNDLVTEKASAANLNATDLANRLKDVLRAPSATPFEAATAQEVARLQVALSGFAKHLLSLVEQALGYGESGGGYVPRHGPMPDSDGSVRSSTTFDLVMEISSALYQFLGAMEYGDFDTMDPFGSPMDQYSAKLELSRYGEILLFPSLLCSALTPLFGGSKALSRVATAGVAVTLLGLISALFFTMKHCFRHAPMNMPFSTNMIRTARKGYYSPVLGRDQEIRELEEALGDLSSDSANSLLVGKSGVGKTEVVKGLAQKIAEGKCPKLEGVTLFHVNTPSLCASSLNPAGALVYFIKRIRGFEGKVILFFDEMHASTDEPSKRSQFLEALKLALDEGEHQIHIIGATDQPASLESNEGLMRRIGRTIPITPFDDKQVLDVLGPRLRRVAPEIWTQKGILSRIVAESNKLESGPSQPSRAQDLMGRCLTELRATQDSPSCLREKRADREACIQTYRLSEERMDSEVGKAYATDMDAIDKELLEIEKRIADQRKRLEEFKRLRQVERRWDADLYQAVHTVAAGHATSADKKRLLFDYYYAPQVYKARAEKMEVQFKDFSIRLDDALLDRVLESLKKPEETVEA
jgi:hypothetical protein